MITVRVQMRVINNTLLYIIAGIINIIIMAKNKTRRARDCRKEHSTFFFLNRRKRHVRV